MAQGGSPLVVVAISGTDAGRAALGRLLRARDYRVRTALPDGQAARLLTAPRPDAIVLDADPHDASVAALLRRLGAGAPPTPIIRLDGSGRASAAADADLVLPSPVPGAVLRRAVRAALRLRRAELEAARAANLKDEIAHRVRGQLAMVIGLLQVQAAQADDQVCAALRGAASRVRTIGELHDVMYAPQGERVSLGAVLRRVAEGARDVFAEGRPVELLVAGHELTCSSAQATDLSVVVHELVANAVRHGGAGPGRRRRVEVRTSCRGAQVCLSVWGSGRPVPKGFDVRAQQGTGLRVVSDLVSQYGGSFTLRPRRGGTLATVRLSAERLA